MTQEKKNELILKKLKRNGTLYRGDPKKAEPIKKICNEIKSNQI